MEDPSTAAWVAPEIVRTSIMGIAVIVAIISVLSVQNTAKKKQTADLLFAVRSDDRLIRASRTLKKLHDSPHNIRLWADPKFEFDSEEQEQQAEDIRYILNHYERLSVGLQSSIYHENMLRKSQYTIITKTFEWAKPFIEGVREKTNSPTAFQEFEWLAKRWGNKELKKRKTP